MQLSLGESLNPPATEGDCRPVDKLIEGLERPIVVLQPSRLESGANSVRRSVCVDAYRELLDATDGTLVILDSHQFGPRLAHARVRAAELELGRKLSNHELQNLAQQAELLVFFDPSGHVLEVLGSAPALCIWCELTPFQNQRPGPSTVNLVTGTLHAFWASRRAGWNLLEYSGQLPTGQEIARAACQLLEAKQRVYGQLAAAREVHLHQLLSWCRNSTPLSAHADRHRTFEHLLREASCRFQDPVMIETGCIRRAEDWSAGYSTYLFAVYLDGRNAGRLHSVDLNADNLRLAAELVKPYAERVTFHASDSVAWLREFHGLVDVLYLDSLDADHPGHAEHALAEIQAAAPKLHEQSLILIDDTVWNNGWCGKGAMAVPWSINQGWRVLKAGYQVLLGR